MRRYNIVYLLTLVLLPILQQLFDKEFIHGSGKQYCEWKKPVG
jgi:hypothetical protein